MAKSIRSKARRKMRNVNRQHFAKKELELLYKSVKTGQQELAENIKLKVKAEKKKAEIPTDTEPKEDASSSMEVDKLVPVYDKKTKRDQNGHYPPWMNQRKVKKHKKKLAAQQKKGNKSIKW